MTLLAVNRAAYVASRRDIKADVRWFDVGDPLAFFFREDAVSHEEILAVALYRRSRNPMPSEMTIELLYGGDGKASELRVFYIVPVKVRETCVLYGRRGLVWVE